MSESVANDIQHDIGDQIKKASSKPAKANAKKPAKAAPKKSKKPAKPAKSASSKQRRPDDGCRAVAKASEGKLDVAQIRILRALKNGKEIDRGDLKEAVGIGREGKYSQSWLTSLWNLSAMKPPLMSINEYEGQRGHRHAITAAGKQALERAESAAKAAAKAAK